MNLYIKENAIWDNGKLQLGFAHNLHFISNVLKYKIILLTDQSPILDIVLESEKVEFIYSNSITEDCKESLIVSIMDNEDCKFAKTLIYDKSSGWDGIYSTIRGEHRFAKIERKTKETDINIELSLEGDGKCELSTGLGFFDHMLEQIGRHSGSDLKVKVKGDLHVDEHHTIEDTAIALGEAFAEAIGDKRGLARYGFFLPMDESICWVAVDFGGRPWLNWVVDFKREYVGDMPTEMFMHFFKSFSDAAKCNLYIKAEGDNEHHKIEGIFKAFAKAIKMALKQEPYSFTLPSTKGLL